MTFEEVEMLPEIEQLRYWLQWCLESCDDSAEFSFGTDATDAMLKLLLKLDNPDKLV